MANKVEFKYAPMFQVGKDDTEYRFLTKEGVTTSEFEGKQIVKVSKEALTYLAQQAFHDVEFSLRRAHNEQVAAILRDPEASENDKYVALQFLRNAETAVKGVLPFCQDTGTAIIHGEKGQQIWTGFEDEEALSKGVYNTFTEDNLRYSQNAPLNMYDEVNTKCNLPAQIDIEATEGDEYRFVMVAKGGGSANKTYFYPMTKATIQNEGTLLPFLVEKMKSLGTAACPPYHICFVVGGTSAEKNLLTVKLGSIKYYDNLPTTGDETGRAFRDIDLENKLLEEAHKIGLGAQFGGKAFAHDIRVIRLPRHGASCPIGMGVSCSADRNIKAKINAEGIWLEKMDMNPSELIPEEYRKPGEGAKGIEIDLDKGMDAVRAELTKYPVSTRVNLKGTIIVARDIAHAKLKARLDAGEDLPQYIKDYPVLYAGPAKTPEGYACGSMGPTTANRMDPYVDEFQEHGGSLVMIAKGNRTQVVTDACKKHGGFYLGTIGGVAAVLSQSCIKSIECVEYPELGMEAVWKIRVEDFPAFILVDDKGHDFFKELKPWTPCNCTK
ncbi:MAG: fumarate hydratase [Prevotella salivae]|jgi:hydrolyase, tartrate beta subunit/fumarate domain protein, Fe-S type|uniref:fumarate hydratase n=1 Tax=Prevotellaceae TaxID=171552 RepID=UPI001C604F2E|nr:MULTISPECIES: fumarate hydratase [Prevotellaceae]MBF1530466.1 fumarate hydratase [Segatella salivae]MBF1532655.1 fumarate hydratase [Segatella salivae]MBF1535043.1 fumarate hydratase [Segatella salivae]MBF1540976.1 fumarate hydratase [Segatella salivae]MBF1564047.1 fumarate hydratase [Segatella salivae]